jgi:hypothetical protein
MNKTDDAVSEYLREVGARLGALPLLQRRELLADLEAHIASERAERNVQSEGEVLEILERLGSPDAVAAAAYEEAGPPPVAPAPVAPAPAAPTPARPFRWWLVAAVAGGVLFLVMVLACAGVLFARTSGKEMPSEPVRLPAPVSARPR